MTDLEICTRIADIEGIKQGYCVRNTPYRCLYNPLTDDALCFKLMAKYDVNVVSPLRLGGATKWEAQIFSDEGEHVTCIYDEYLNKAICIAIIEAHGED